MVDRTSHGEASSRSYRILFALGAGAPMSATLNRPTNIAGCESVKGLEQLFSQLLEQPGVAHFAGVGSGGGVASVGGRD